MKTQRTEVPYVAHDDQTSQTDNQRIKDITVLNMVAMEQMHLAL